MKHLASSLCVGAFLIAVMSCSDAEPPTPQQPATPDPVARKPSSPPSQPIHPDLEIGDSMPDYMSKHLVTHKRKIEGFSSWSEGKELTGATYMEGDDVVGPVFLVANDAVPYGVLQGKPPNAYYLFDTNCDGRLDFTTTKALLPICLMLSTSQVTDPADTQVRDAFDLLFQSFHVDEGPDGSPLVQRAYSILDAFLDDPQKPNRDLAYLIWYYNEMSQIPSQGILAMRLLEERYQARFGRVHPLILLFRMESHINAGEFELARRYQTRLEQLRPDFVPARFYRRQLSEDEAEREAIRVNLTKEHPDHWLVKIMNQNGA